jgi:serine/threonine-protein kinase
MALVSGNPYLTQLALYHLSNEEITLNELHKTAIAEDGIYGSHLRHQLWRLKRYPELLADLQRIVLSPSPLEVEPIQAFKLQSLGVVRVQNQRVSPRCELYARYFKLALAIT